MTKNRTEASFFKENISDEFSLKINFFYCFRGKGKTTI